MAKVIQTRRQMTINTDPQRRCYNGCHARTEEVWTPWELLVYLKHTDTEEEVAEKVAFWRDLNAHAIQARGPENTRREFCVVDEITEEVLA